MILADICAFVVGHTVKRCPQANAGNEAGTGGFETDNAGNFNDGPSGFANANAGSWGGAGAANAEAGAVADSGWMNTGPAPDTSNTWGTAPTAATVGGW